MTVHVHGDIITLIGIICLIGVYTMLFSSTIFLFVFLPTALLGYHIVFRRNDWKNYFLLLASLIFYAWGEPVYVFLMIGSVIGNFVFGLAIDKAKRQKTRRLWLIITVIFNLGILFCFKYLGFVAANLNLLLHTELTVPALALPIGISFFTFQAMSYVIDVYRGTTEVQKNPLYLALYISFFPQLIAGPIVRYNTIAQQINERHVTLEGFQAGVFRFIQGFAKKVILANVMALTAEKGFQLAAEQNLSVAMAWLGSLAYTFQIFFDFSGYSDMAIGLGRMFGFEFEENFRFPYISKSVSEFWNRWHISLGHWFRDYVYFPLGGSRVSKGKMLRNLFVVWLLTGIWHGAAWQFIVWGVLYGLIISFEKLSGIPRKFKNPWAIGAYGVLTFLAVNAGWVLFGSKGIDAALYQLKVMLGIGAAGLCDSAAVYAITEYWAFYLASAFFSTPLSALILKRLNKSISYRYAEAIVYMLLLIISVSFLVMGSHNPFIYFNF